MLSAYGTIANGGVRMPRQMIMKVVDEDGKQIWPLDDAEARGRRGHQPAGRLHHHGHPGRQHRDEDQPVLGRVRHLPQGRPPPRRVQDRARRAITVDVHAYGYLAPPKDPDRPALAAGVWMGNSNNDPNKGSLSLDSSAPLWSALLEEVSAKYGISKFKAPGGLQTATVDAFTGLKPGPFTKKTVKELFLQGHRPDRARDDPRLAHRRRCLGPAVAGRLRRAEGAARLLRPSRGREQLPGLAEGQPQLGRARRPGARASRRPRGNQDRVLLQQRDSVRSAARGGRRSPRRTKCPLAPPPDAICDPLVSRCRPASRASRRRPMTAGTAAAVAATSRRRRPRSRPEADADEPRQRLTIVAPSPPSPRSPGPRGPHQRVRRRRPRGPRRAVPRCPSRG